MVRTFTVYSSSSGKSFKNSLSAIEWTIETRSSVNTKKNCVALLHMLDRCLSQSAWPNCLDWFIFPVKLGETIMRDI